MLTQAWPACTDLQGSTILGVGGQGCVLACKLGAKDVAMKVPLTMETADLVSDTSTAP